MRERHTWETHWNVKCLFGLWPIVLASRECTVGNLWYVGWYYIDDNTERKLTSAAWLVPCRLFGWCSVPLLKCVLKFWAEPLNRGSDCLDMLKICTEVVEEQAVEVENEMGLREWDKRGSRAFGNYCEESTAAKGSGKIYSRVSSCGVMQLWDLVNEV